MYFWLINKTTPLFLVHPLCQPHQMCWELSAPGGWSNFCILLLLPEAKAAPWGLCPLPFPWLAFPPHTQLAFPGSPGQSFYRPSIIYLKVRWHLPQKNNQKVFSQGRLRLLLSFLDGISQAVPLCPSQATPTFVTGQNLQFKQNHELKALIFGQECKCFWCEQLRL